MARDATGCPRLGSPDDERPTLAARAGWPAAHQAGGRRPADPPVHAGIVDLRAWDPLVPHLVAAGYRVIRYDVRAYGMSTTEDVEFSNRADLLAVLDELGVERAVFVGNSRGAMICLDTLLESPQRCAAFIWVGGGIGGFEAEIPPAEMARFDEADRLYEAKDWDGLLELEVNLWVDGILQPAGRAPAWIRDSVREMDRPLLQPDRIEGRPIPLAPPANERLDEIHAPVLAVVGDLDTADTQAAAVRLEDAVPGARRVVLHGVAHMVGMEAPERLAELIIETVRPLGPWA